MVSNDELEKKYNLKSIEKLTKLKSRYFFDDIKEVDEYILKAINKALENTNITNNNLHYYMFWGSK